MPAGLPLFAPVLENSNIKAKVVRLCDEPFEVPEENGILSGLTVARDPDLEGRFQDMAARGIVNPCSLIRRDYDEVGCYKFVNPGLLNSFELVSAFNGPILS